MPRAKLNVLITRPEKQGRALAKRCAQLKISSVVQPLMSYQANCTSTQISQVLANTNQPILIFVSVAAVELAHHLLSLNQWHYSEVFAVGKATQKALAEVNVAAKCPTLHTSEGLLALDELNQVNQQDVIIVRGDGGRELIAQTLAQRGANVNYLEVYQKAWLTFPEKISQTWRDNEINCIVVTSNTLLESVVNLIDLCDNYWKTSCLWIVASQRIAEKAQALGLKNVIDAQGASDDAILAVLTQYGIGS